jgi:hypothetical protein
MLEGQVVAKICFDIVRDEGPDVALLIGAGCSGTAGIPLAARMVEEILSVEKYAKRCEGLPDKSYPKVVAKLSPDEFRDLFGHYLDGAKLNLAHLCIAELLAHKVVNRILTTNFDSLLMQACVLAGVYPAIYDCIAIKNLQSVLDDKLPALYYLHGQSYGLGVANTPLQLETHSPLVKDVIYQSIRPRTLIVVGCNSAPEGVLKHLSDIDTSRHVIWVPSNETDAKGALEGLRPEKVNGRWVLEDHKADVFFCELLKSLDLKPPAIIHDAAGFAGAVRKRVVADLPDCFHPIAPAPHEPAAPELVIPELPPTPPKPDWQSASIG